MPNPSMVSQLKSIFCLSVSETSILLLTLLPLLKITQEIPPLATEKENATIHER